MLCACALRFNCSCNCSNCSLAYISFKDTLGKTLTNKIHKMDHLADDSAKYKYHAKSSVGIWPRLVL